MYLSDSNEMKSVFLSLISALMLTACSSKIANQKPVILGPHLIILNGDSDSRRAGEILTVNFAFDSSALDQTAKEILTTNADYLKNHTLVSVQIEGHCDERGSRQYNLALGERRASAVRNFLKGLGIRGQRMKMISLGNEKLLATGDSETSHAKNRRTNFIILGK